jgi:hypothetical protein
MWTVLGDERVTTGTRKAMTCIRPVVAGLCALAMLTAAAPAARASTPGFLDTTPLGGLGIHSGGVVGTPGACGTSAGSDVGSWSGTTDIVCVGAGLSFIGPAVGQVASVIGPTIIGPVVIGKSVVSGGNVVGN